MSIIPDILRDCRILVTVPGDGTEPFPNVPTTDRERLLGRTHSTIGAELPTGKLYRIEHSAALVSNKNRPISTEVYGPVRQAFLDNLVPGLVDERQIVDAERRDYEQYQKFVARRSRQRQLSDERQAEETARLLRKRDQSMRLAAIALEAEQARAHEEQARKRQRGAAAWAQVNAELAAEEAALRLKRAQSETSREQLEAELAKLAEEKAQAAQEKAAAEAKQAGENAKEVERLTEDEARLILTEYSGQLDLLISAIENQSLFFASPVFSAQALETAIEIANEAEIVYAKFERVAKERKIPPGEQIDVDRKIGTIRKIRDEASAFRRKTSETRAAEEEAKRLLRELSLSSVLIERNFERVQKAKELYDASQKDDASLKSLQTTVRDAVAQAKLQIEQANSTLDKLEKIGETLLDDSVKATVDKSRSELQAASAALDQVSQENEAATLVENQELPEEESDDGELESEPPQQIETRYNFRTRNQQ
jgi:hypothetical protein